MVISEGKHSNPDNASQISSLQARIEEVGQSLLRSAHDRDDSAFSQLKRRKGRSSRTHDAYEEHLLLLEDRVVVLTDRAIVCILAPGFASIHAAAEQGSLTGAPEIKNAEIRWAVVWEVSICLAHVAANSIKQYNYCPLAATQMGHIEVHEQIDGCNPGHKLWKIASSL